jgi:hypothetical protein
VEAGPLTSHKYLRFILDVLSPTTITVLFLAHAASSQSLLSGPVDSSCPLRSRIFESGRRLATTRGAQTPKVPVRVHPSMGATDWRVGPTR